MIELLKPVCEVVAGLDLSDPTACERMLEQAFPDLSPLISAIRSASDLTPRRASEQVLFGRISKPTEATHGLSIDAVEMRGVAAGHTHPKGEVSLAVAIEGAPTFMGCAQGWVVAAPGSHHVPEVLNGTMRIVYFLPQGAMVFD